MTSQWWLHCLSGGLQVESLTQMPISRSSFPFPRCLPLTRFPSPLPFPLLSFALSVGIVTLPTSLLRLLHGVPVEWCRAVRSNAYAVLCCARHSIPLSFALILLPYSLLPRFRTPSISNLKKNTHNPSMVLV